MIKYTHENTLGYKWFAQECLDLQSNGVRATKDGENIVICKYTPELAILFYINKSGFLCHPRSGPLRDIPITEASPTPTNIVSVYGGGYRLNQSGVFEEIENRTTYPLEDFDKGTFIIEPIDTPSAEWTSEENYGNCWWVGSEGEVLSWRGAPNRYWDVAGTTNIPGISTAEIEINKTQIFTSFGIYVYSEGAILCKAPTFDPLTPMSSLIVGAFFYVGKLYVMTVSRDSLGIGFYLWSSSDSGATFTQIGDRVPTTRAKVPCFISPQGDCFIYENVYYKLSTAGDSISEQIKMPDDVMGTKRVTGNRGAVGGVYEFNGATAYTWYGLNSTNTPVYSTLTHNAKFDYNSSGNSEGSSVDVPIYTGNPATSVTIHRGTIVDGIIPFSATANGAYCSVSWSGVDSFQGLSAVKRVANCNSDLTVSVTLNPMGITQTYSESTVIGAFSISGDVGVPSIRGVTEGQYTAINAIGPVTWTNSKGTISESGYATFSGCGSATITATDSCGRSDSLSVALSDGDWINDIGFADCNPIALGCGSSYYIKGTSRYNACIISDLCANMICHCNENCTAATLACNTILGISVTHDGVHFYNYVARIYSKDDWGCR